jgi:hypothetical protein
MSLLDLIAKSNIKTHGRVFHENAWGARHVQAMTVPRGIEVPIVVTVCAAARYADDYQERYGSPIGHDHVLGPAWLSIIGACRVLLNGEAGRLDCGTLDSLLLDMGVGAGFKRADVENA